MDGMGLHRRHTLAGGTLVTEASSTISISNTVKLCGVPEASGNSDTSGSSKDRVQRRV